MNSIGDVATIYPSWNAGGAPPAARAQGATRRAVLVAAAVLVATALPARPAAAASTVRTIARFVAAAGETPENLAIAPDGALHVSLASASQVRRILPGSAPARVTLPARAGIVVGVAIDHRAGALDVAVRSKDARAAGMMADDFASDTRGALDVAANAWNELLRLDPSGRQTVLATKAADGLDTPSAVAFGVGAERAVLYVTNAACVSDRPRPSVQRFIVGVPGLALP